MGYLEERAGLAGKRAIMVGGGAGIGAALSTALAKTGVDLAILDIDAEGLAETRKAVESCGRKVTTAVGDATDEKTLDSFYDTAAEAFGGAADIVVNVVGGVLRMNFDEMDRATIAENIQRNYGYVVQSVQRAIPLLRKSGKGGSIINFTTIEAHRGAGGFSVYAGAKAATTNFTRAMAVELGKEGIRVNCLAPDTTPSRGNQVAMPPKYAEDFAKLPPEAMTKGMEMYIPRGIQPPTEALADGVLFLASDLSAFVTGMTLHVDGGTMAAAGFLEWPFGDGFVPTPMAGTLARMYPGKDAA